MMKAKPDCVACMFKQALNTARLITDDPKVHLQILARVGEQVAELSLDRTPANLSQPAYEAVAEITGVSDPYAQQKKESNRIALKLVPKLKSVINASKDPLNAALHAAVAGNIIDLGIGHKFDIENDALEIMKQNFAISAVEDFRKELGPGRKLLYLGDNAGEIVFDTLLVEHLLETGTDVTFTVKSGPIINDATMEDAEQAGMTRLVSVIETGASDIGINWNNISDEFREAFESADVIIAKGHGNFETCNDRRQNIYFLLKVKCQMVADEIGVGMGDIVFKHLRRK